MATISVEIPAAAAVRVEDAFAGLYAWQPQIPDPDNPDVTIDNPVTKHDLVVQRVRQFILDAVVAWESNAAATAARKEKADEVKSALWTSGSGD